MMDTSNKQKDARNNYLLRLESAEYQNSYSNYQI